MNYYKKKQFTHELTKEAKTLRFTVETSISAEVIENIIVGALESTSTYWVGLDNTTPEWKNKPEDFPTSQYATQLLLEGKNITLYDIENEEEVWELNLQKVLKGIGIAFANGDDIEDDTDNILQYALFGELVYG